VTKTHEQLIQRIREELNDSYDEERELEHDDQNTDEIHELDFPRSGRQSGSMIGLPTVW
jgi:hypothetical protein